ncbi:MAG: tRNA 4-thiouridine(8) synthase ThiI [Anaerolineae bacterium]|nr:tRNA 4-thiouridine(8) synthase ThiI [Anaerolineae bacterium]
MPDEETLIVARYGEIALKGRNRPRFVRQVRRNMSAALAAEGVPGEVRLEGRRIYALTPHPEAALGALARVFGVTSLSPAVRVPADLEAIKRTALEQLILSGVSPDRTLRVAARRSYKGFPLTSPQINREVGEFLVQQTGAGVDLSDEADLTVGVEVHQDHALVYARVVPGAGGLPIPLSGRVVALMSAGLDSPVAAWMMMKRGCAVIPLHFAGVAETMEERFRRLCGQLQKWSQSWRLQPVIRSHAEALKGAAERLRVCREERWTCLFCKRAMVAEAEKVAREHGAQGIVLGDSLGQVASQTLENMRVISAGASLPIFRPLIGLDKVEIMALARRIGTYDLSAQAAPVCPYLPDRPLTQASYDKFLALRPQIEVDR